MKQVKVGILSMQRIFNYGSFLQAYALKQMIRELGCEVQFVDYHPGECLISPDGRMGVMRKISKVIEVFKYKAPIKEKIRFIKYKKNYAKNYYPFLEIDEHMNYAPQIDVLVIGSDEVFNCVQNNSNVGFSPELFGVGSNAKKIISYAASFGNTTLEKLEQYKVKDKIAKWLNDFFAISVRDTNSIRIIRELTSETPEYNIDPVLAYDFIGKCKEVPHKVPESKYMILYGYSGRFNEDECRAVSAFADKQGLEIFCIGGVQNCCDKFIDCSPFEVIAYFLHAEAVVTDTFHGTILSVIAHRNFVSFVRSSGYGNVEKLTDLLDRLHLNDRIVCDMSELDSMLTKPIKYDKVDFIIKNERDRTYDYLKQQLLF